MQIIPSLEQTLDTLKDYILTKYNWIKIGKIESVDFEKHCVAISLAHKYKANEKIYEYPLLVKCPIQLFYTKNGGILFPIEIGSSCLVCFNDVSLDEWKINGSVNLPSSKRFHNITDAIILPCISHLNDTSNKSFDNNSTELFYKNTAIKLTEKINISNSTNSLKDILQNTLNFINDSITNNNTLISGVVSSQYITIDGKTAVMSPSSQSTLNVIISQNNAILTQLQLTLNNLNNLMN